MLVMSTVYRGRCHCGAIEVEYTSGIAPAEAELRECQCSFCRKHGALATSDPGGCLRFIERAPGSLNRYVFGLKTADFFTCRTCGVYVGIILRDGDDGYGIVNIRTLQDAAQFTAEPIAADYDAETTDQRIARRKAMWTPAEAVAPNPSP